MEFKDAINQAIQADCEKKPILLLGNGFSVSFVNEFSYHSLFDVAKDKLDSGKKLSEELVGVFTEIGTVNFEEVLDALHSAEKIIKCYETFCNGNVTEKLRGDIKNIRDSFIESFLHVHPLIHYLVITDDKKNSARQFLSYFSKIFTTNYDLLLYWITVSGENPSCPRDDGFYRSDPSDPLVWNSSNSQDIYYLHGAFHIFENNAGFEFDRNIYKIAQRSDNQFIINKVSENIYQDCYPVIVFEGECNQKIKRINKNQYLWYSYEEFKKISGSLFIFGSSLNNTSDKHIIDSIKNNEGIKSIYIGLYDIEDIPLKETANYLRDHKKEINFFDSKSALDWDPASLEEYF